MRSAHRRLLFIVNEAGFFLSHRLEIALAARERGYEVHVATAPGPQAAQIERQGMRHHPLPLSRSGMNPLVELRTFRSIRSVIRAVRPDIVHLVTIKPVLYGGIAARLEKVPGVVAAISGLGHLFSPGTASAVVRTAMVPLYRFALAGSGVRVIFQNTQDQQRLSTMVGLKPEAVILVPGSGVALDRYPVAPEPRPPPVVVTFASRLLRSKGVVDFVDAARLLRGRGHSARFLVAGGRDPGNPLSLSERDVAELRQEGVVEMLGHRTDLPDLFARSHVVVLPSYYGEGLPKVLLEAAACGRPIVTTDHPGCRDAIVPDQTGLLVPVRDVPRLADAIERLISDTPERAAMGRAGRDLAERRFSIDKVVGAHLAVYEALRAGIRSGADGAAGMTGGKTRS